MFFYNTFLPGLLNVSITASVVILLVLLLRFLFRKAPKIISYALWGIVLFRLLCPVALQSDLSLFNLMDPPITAAGTLSGSIEYIPSDIGRTKSPSVTLPAPGASDIINDNLPQGEEQTAAGSSEAFWTIAAYVWAAGVLAMALYTVKSYFHLRKKLITASPLRDNIYLADEITSPFVMGLIRPKIYLPSFLDEREQSYILMHEQHHIRRLDPVIKALAFAALCIHWFNPLVWAAFILAGKDMEMSCDEAVIRKLGTGILADYTTSLLSLATGKNMITGMPLAFGEGDPKGRIRNLARWKKAPFWVVLTAIAAFIILAVCLLTNPKQDQFSLRIVVPAGSEETVVYADAEICPVGNSIIISSGEGLHDTEISLKPAVPGEETSQDKPVYLTPGMPVKMEVEKGVWFKVGVNIQNSTDKDIIVYVNVKNVQVRIPSNDLTSPEQYQTDYIGNAPKVSQIAQLLPYPKDYRYSSIELQTDAEPYELRVKLTGKDSVKREDFEQAASLAFESIGNLGIISFWREDATEPLAIFERDDAEESSPYNGLWQTYENHPASFTFLFANDF